MKRDVKYTFHPLETPSCLNERQLQLLDRLMGIPSPSGEEQEKLDYIANRLSEVPGCRITRQRVDQNRCNVIAEKGEGGQFTVMLYAHVDTVRRRDGWKNHYRLVRDEASGKLGGVGVVDMQTGVMMVIDILEQIVVPPGIKIIGAFSPAEETDSAGAQALKTWEGMREVDLILSPEIATLAREDRDQPKDFIIGRRGILKTGASITTPGGHGYQRDVPSAITAARELLNHLMAAFHLAKRRNKLFGEEQLDETFFHADESDYLDRPSHAQFGLRHMLLPGHSLAQALDWQIGSAQRLAEEKQWARQGIQFVLEQRRDRTSYEPFLTDANDAVVSDVVVKGAQEIFGGVELGGGLSPTDGCILAQLGKPMVEIGPSGGDAHRGTEWASEQSVARTLALYRHLIERKLPEYLSARGDAAK